MKCPVCGQISLERHCAGCGRSLEGAYALAKASGRFYNEGLQYAREHRLEHARQSLKKAIRYNPENLPARNLLGLVYMETGEIGMAVAEWTRSVEIEPELVVNPAVEYLKKASRTVGRPAQMKEAVRLYNQALDLLKDEQMDTAMLHLKKAVAQSENYVRARELLALCYMKTNQYSRAVQLLREVERIDREDPQLPHMRWLCQTSMAEWENSRDGKEAAALEAAKEQEAPAQETTVLLSGNSPRRSIRTALRQNPSVVQFLLFVLGLVVGLMFMVSLVTPQMMSDVRRERNEMAAQLQELQAQQAEEDDRVAELQEQLVDAGLRYDMLGEEYAEYKEMLSTLLRAVEYYHQDEYDNMRTELAKLSREKLTNEQRLVFDWLNEK